MLITSTLNNEQTMKKLTPIIFLSLVTPAYADIPWTVSGEFEYDHVSVKDGDTTDDLTKAEIAVAADIDDAVSAELVIAGIDEETDTDSTVDDDLEIDAATVSYALSAQNLDFTLGMWGAPVGQFETLSASDPLALGEVETTRNRGMIVTWQPADMVTLTAFSGTMDDTASTNLSGGNIELALDMVTINVGQISDTAGDIADGALTYALTAGYADFTLMAEGVEMDDTDNTKFTHLELNYAFTAFDLPFTVGIGQSKQSQDSTGDSTQDTITAAFELSENLSVTIDQTTLEEPGEAEVEQTSLKVGFAF